MSAPLVAPDDPPAVRFGRFVILEKAGAGAMGTVYAAYDPDLDRRVALKVLRSSTAGQQRERIRREALAMARVSHPNVVQIYEVGEHEGRLFIAMQYVDGTTLGVWQAERRPWRQVARMYAEVARGLAAAHAAGLVHRDFKPDNVLVDTDGHPRIIDFGLARAADSVVEDPPPDEAPPRISGEASLVGSNDLLAHDLTRTGHVMGTPAYMAPELMERAPPTPRSDQFAFGVACYEAVCGQPPFPRDSLIGLKLAVMRGAVRPPPTDRELPGPMARLLLKTLSPDPAGRYASMHAVIAELEQLVVDDELIDWRPRIVIVILLGLGLGLAALGQGSGDGPPTVGGLIRAELLVSGFIIACMLPFHRVLRSSTLHRRAAIWLLLMTPAKVMMPVVGWVYGVEPAAIRGFDTVLVAAMAGVAVYLIHPPVWPALLIALGCLAGLLIEPAWNAPLHGLASMALMLVVGLRAVRTVRRARLRGAGGQKSA